MDEVSMRLAARPPYTHHILKVRRSTSTGKLLLEVESFAPGGGALPARIEVAQARQMLPRLPARYGITAEGVIQSLTTSGYSARLIAELVGDLALAEMSLECSDGVAA